MSALAGTKSNQSNFLYRRLLLPVYVPTLLSSTSLEALLVLVPLSVLESGTGAAVAAFLIGLRGVGMFLFDLPVGVILARLGDKPVVFSGLIALTLSALLFALSSNFWVMSFAATLSGVGFTAWLMGRQSFITGAIDIGERGRAIAVMAGIMRLGSFVGPAACALVAAEYGFRMAFIVLTVVMGGATLLVYIFTPYEQPQHPTRVAAVASIARIISQYRKVFATGGLASAGLQLMRAAKLLLIPLFGYFLDLGVVAIGLIISLSALIDSALFYPVGIVMDRYGRKWTGVPCLLLFTVSLAILPLATGFYSLLSISLLASVANGLGTGLLLTLGSDLAPASSRGEFLGVWQLVGDMGLVGGPLLIGVLIQFASIDVAAVAIAGIGLVSTVILYCLVDETIVKAERD